MALSFSYSRAKNAPRPRTKAAIPTDQDGVLDVLGNPYGGPENGADSHGQFFTPNTDFRADLIPLPPVFYYHGSEHSADPEPIGKTIARWVDSAGVWYRVVLDMSHDVAQKLWDAALADNLYASTGVVSAFWDVLSSGEIARWLVGELSLIDPDPESGREPANYYAIAAPRVKSLVAGLPPDTQRLFDTVYLTGDTPPPSKPRSKRMWEELRQKLRELLGVIDNAEQSSASADDVENAADTADQISDALDAAADGMMDDGSAMDTSAMDTATKCASCGGTCGDTTAQTQTMVRAKSKSSKAADPQVAALQQQVARLQNEQTARNDADWITQQIKAGRMVPSERESVVNALARAHQADARIKSGGSPTADSIRALVQARPQTTPVNGDLRLAGFDTPAKVEETVDEDYMKRMRGYVGAPKGGAK